MTEAGHNWHQTTVAKVESASRPVRVNEAQVLATVLDVTLFRLLDEDHDHPNVRVQSLQKELAIRREVEVREHSRLLDYESRVALARQRVRDTEAFLAAALQEQERAARG